MLHGSTGRITGKEDNPDKQKVSTHPLLPLPCFVFPVYNKKGGYFLTVGGVITRNIISPVWKPEIRVPVLLFFCGFQ